MTTCHVHTVSSLCLVNIIQKCPPKTFLHKLSILHPFFCPPLQKMKKGGCQRKQNPFMSSSSKKGRNAEGGGGSKISIGGGQTTKTAEVERTEDCPKRLSVSPLPFLEIHSLALCLIAEYLILVLRGLRLHDYTVPANPARRGGIWPIRPPPKKVIVRLAPT